VRFLRRRQPSLFQRRLPQYAYLGEGAYIAGSAALAQAFEDLVDTAFSNWTIIALFRTDPELGGPSTYRAAWSASGDDDTNGSFYAIVRDNPAGKSRIFARDDGGSDVISQAPPARTSHVVFDGGTHLLQYYDTAVGDTGTAKIKSDGEATETLDASYARSGIGALDLFSPFGDVRGPDPQIDPLLGWGLFFALIKQDLSASGDDIWDAFNDVAPGGAPRLLSAGIANMLAAVESATVDPATNILYAHEYLRGRAPAYGDAPTLTDVTYSTPGSP